MRDYLLIIVLFFNLNNVFCQSKLRFVNQVINRTLNEDQRSGSFLVVNVDGIVRQYKRWQRLMPRVRPFYALKANPLPIIAEVMAALGSGYDCASQGEIKQLLLMGVPAQDMIFANTFKIKSHIMFARKYGITKMTFDSITELKKTAQLFPNAEQVLRIRVEDSKATIPLGSKFGATEELIPEILKVAKDLNVKLIGVSFHVGTNTTDDKVYANAIQRAKDTFDLAFKYGHRMTLLDIGGGFPSGYSPPKFFKAQAKLISKTIDELFPRSDPRFSDLQVIAEPGRFFAGNNPIVVRVYGERMASDGIWNVFVNDGVHQSFRGVKDSNLPAIPIVFETSAPKRRPNIVTTMWGPTCDPKDYIFENYSMPKIHIDDAVMFEQFGAYTVTWSSTFNGFTPAFPVVAITSYAINQLKRTDRWKRVVDVIESVNKLKSKYYSDYDIDYIYDK